MKKVMYVVIAVFAVVILCSFRYQPFEIGSSVDVQEKKLHGHIYVIAVHNQYHGGGVSIIHSAACPCNNKKN